MHLSAVLKVSNACCVIPVLKMRSTLPLNIASDEFAGIAYGSLNPVKSLALRRAVIQYI